MFPQLTNLPPNTLIAGTYLPNRTLRYGLSEPGNVFHFRLVTLAMLSLRKVNVAYPELIRSALYG